MFMRRLGVAVLVVHHANKKGDQRGTSRREDVLDLVMAMRRPVDYEPKEGARFELRFEKARGLVGEDVEPIDVRMAQDAVGVMRWPGGRHTWASSTASWRCSRTASTRRRSRENSASPRPRAIDCASGRRRWDWCRFAEARGSPRALVKLLAWSRVEPGRNPHSA
jgi:hypothetical protein